MENCSLLTCFVKVLYEQALRFENVIDTIS